MNIENILVPFDFSRYSDAALQMASYIARDHGATLHVVHVKEPVLVYHVEGNYIVHPYGDLDGLKTTLETVTPADPTVEIRHWLMTGDVVEDILSLADQQQIDLIVMGTHGRTGLKRMLIGSVAEGVLRHAKCPVLTVKTPQRVRANDAELAPAAGT